MRAANPLLAGICLAIAGGAAVIGRLLAFWLIQMVGGLIVLAGLEEMLNLLACIYPPLIIAAALALAWGAQKLLLTRCGRGIATFTLGLTAAVSILVIVVVYTNP